VTKAETKAAEKAEYEARVRAAFAEAEAASEKAFEDFRASADKAPEGYIKDSCGSASLVIYKPSYRFRTTLRSMDLISPGYKGAWGLGGFSRIVTDQSITASEKAHEAARDVLRKHFPEEPEIYMQSHLD
jgi:hypothetical protein